MTAKTKLVSAKEFYNEIATNYDEFLSMEKDKIVRDEVKAYFCEQVNKGSMLDFGGGTGLDLMWLVEAEYQVYFCEPAEKMREKAIELSQNWSEEKRPIFLENPLHNFQNWDKGNLPFKDLNAILMNFGVINYIENLESLFDLFAQVTNKEADLIINLLSIRPQKKYSKLLKNVLKAFVKRENVKTGSSFNNMQHETTLYSPKEIEKAAKKFKLVTKKSLGHQSDFTLLHFKKL